MLSRPHGPDDRESNELTRFRGREVKTTGDGGLASFDSLANSLCYGHRQGHAALGIDVRSGPADALPMRLDPELRRAVDDRAAVEHTTASDVVREALRHYLKTG